MSKTFNTRKDERVFRATKGLQRALERKQAATRAALFAGGFDDLEFLAAREEEKRAARVLAAQRARLGYK